MAGFFNYHSYLPDAPEAVRGFRVCCGLGVAGRDALDGLYPFPASLVFGRGLQFMALLRRDAPKN